MTKTRRVLMVVFVATALSADRVATAAPALRPQNLAETARSVAGRLVVSLRRIVPAVRIQEVCRDEKPAAAACTVVPCLQRVIHPCLFSTWQDRLPPPVAPAIACR